MRNIPTIILATIQTILSAILVILLYQSGLIPRNLLLVVGAILLLILFALIFILFRTKSLFIRIPAYIISAAVIAACTFGIHYAHEGMSTLRKITEISVEHTEVGIYTNLDYKDIHLEEMSECSFGILETLDRENTDKTLVEMESIVGRDISVRSYGSLPALIDSLLLAGETDAIILNTAFIDLLSEMEGYENSSGQLYQILLQRIATVVEIEESVEEEEKSDAEEAEEEDGYVFTMYISGIDSRKGLVSKSRTDVNILAVVNSKTRQILLVSTPRDYYVPLSISNGTPDKLTHAGIYGIDVCMDTLEMLYDTEIDYYFRVNFSGFEKIIDALGGITVESDYAFDAGMFGVTHSFVKGTNELNGASALAFAHERYAFADGDRQRGRNQMKVIEGVIRKAVSPALLKNYSEIMDSVAGCFETSVPYEVITGLVQEQLSDGGNWDVNSYSVTGSGASKQPYSMSMRAYVMEPDYSTVEIAIEKMMRVRAGES